VAPVDAVVQTLLIGDAMEGAPAAVFVADDSRRFLAVNKFACDLLGYTRDELLALRADELVPTADVAAQFDELVATGTLSGSADVRRKDGSIVRLHYRTGETTVSGIQFWVTVGFPE
jgi:PAS domain S-box-containing protein